MITNDLQVKVTVTIIAAIGFGIWQASIGAGLFMGMVFTVVICESDEWRILVTNGKS